MQKFKEIEDSRYSYQNKIDKACFQHEMGYKDIKDLTRKTQNKLDKAIKLVFSMTWLMGILKI